MTLPQTAITLLFLWSALLLTPGPDFMLMLKATVNDDYPHALATAAGINVAIACSITLVIFGFEFIFTQNPLLFQTIKIIGALYLIYLGFRIVQSASAHADLDQSRAAPPSLATSFRQGLWCNLLNPKVPIMLGSVFGQLIALNTPIAIKLLFGLEILLINTVLWGLFPLMIHIPRIRSLLLDHMTVINRVVGSALCLLGALAFI
jgi:threonine/homoserine/homoserine lactone efflux protein